MKGREDDSFKEFAEEQLRGTGSVFQRMFGGWGLYAGEAFFGIVDKGSLYFKVAGEEAEEYRRRGMGPFRATPKMTLKSFYEVPVDVLEDRETLLAWMDRAVAAAREASAKRPRQAR
jgi:DNA transformation protein and related proteins